MAGSPVPPLPPIEPESRLDSQKRRDNLGVPNGMRACASEPEAYPLDQLTGMRPRVAVIAAFLAKGHLPKMNHMAHFKKEQAIPTELLGKVFDLYTEMPADELVDFESRFFGLCEYLQEIGLENEPQSFALIIDRRLAALAKFVVNDTGDKLQNPGMNYGRADLIRCAATQPLIEDEEGQVTFDREDFHRCLRAEIKGRSGN